MSPLEMSPLAFAVAIGAVLLSGALVYSVLRSSPRPGRGFPRIPEHHLGEHERTRDEAARMRSDSERIRRAIEHDCDSQMLDQLSDELHLQGEREREEGEERGSSD